MEFISSVLIGCVLTDVEKMNSNASKVFYLQLYFFYSSAPLLLWKLKIIYCPVKIFLMGCHRCTANINVD